MALMFWMLSLASLLISVVSVSMPGGLSPGDVNDITVQKWANTVVEDIDAGFDSTLKAKLIEVTKVQTQVVSGIKYYLTIIIGETSCVKSSLNEEIKSCPLTETKAQLCDVQVWVQEWLNKHEIVSQNCTMKQETPLLGGKVEMGSETKEVLEVAKFAIDELNAKRNSMFRMVLSDVVHVTRQTVNGYKYELEIVIGMSKCKNPMDNGATDEHCTLDDDAELEMCTFIVVKNAVSGEHTVLKSECSPVEEPDSIADAGATDDSDKNMIGGDGHDQLRGRFSAFKKTYNKVYSSPKEEAKRFSIFMDNMRRADKLQSTEKGTAKYGVTQFSDMPGKEFRKYYLSPTWNQSFDARLSPATIPQTPAPDAFDWRDHGAVTPVKNQGSCGSCWAFSTTGNVEGQWAIRKKSLVELSEQELVDCDKLDDGCEGGLPSNAYQEIMRLGGLDTETKYPYDGEDEKCKFKVSDARIYINASLNISSNEADMAAWLAEKGPISIGINANAMQFYMGGVSHPWSFLCDPDNLDHGVLIVGYGTKKRMILPDVPYWIIKNSWGPTWGEEGYYRVYRGGGTCGLNRMPTSAVVN